MLQVTMTAAATCVVSSSIGGLLIGWTIADYIQNGSYSKLPVAGALVLVLVLPILVVVNDSVQATAQKTKAGQEKLDKDAIMEEFFVRNAALNGHEARPDRFHIRYRLINGQMGRPVYTGINLYGLPEAKVDIDYRAESLHWRMESRWTENQPWKYLHTTTPFKARSDNQILYLRGFSKTKRHNGTVLDIPVTITMPDHQVPIMTTYTAHPGQELAWGALPATDKYTWKVFVRFSDVVGQGLSDKDISEHPGRITLGTGQSDSFPVADNNMISVSSEIVERPDQLTIGVPNVPSKGIVVEVTLVIELRK